MADWPTRLALTKIVNDPKSCIFSSYLRCWPPAGSAWPRSDQDDRFASVPAGVRWTSRRFSAATAVGVEFVDEMFAATSPARGHAHVVYPPLDG